MTHSDHIHKPHTITNVFALILWAATLLSISSPAFAQWDHEKVMGTSECSECHEESVDVWKKTVHQKNYKALSKNKDAKAIAKKLKIKKIKNDKSLCATCHYTVGTKKGRAKIVAGVSCESCHSPAKDWVNIHNDYGGKGITDKNESADHKKNRLAKLEKLGMIRPDNTYGWAKNCLNCHIVPNEKLVNIGGHPAGSDFKLSKRTQGEVRHYPKADIDKLRYYNLISHSTELELSLAALVKAKGGEYATEMASRAKNALEKLKKANDSTPNTYAQKIIALAHNANISAGNAQLTTISKNIAVNIMLMVQKETGYRYDSSKLKSTPVAKAVAKPKQAVKVTPKPVAKPKPVVKATPKPAAKPKPVVKVAPKAVTKPKPATKTVSSAPLESLESISEDTITTEGNQPLLVQFDIVMPGNVALCQTYSPWMLGKQKVNSSTRFTEDACFGINITAGRLSQMYIFSETKNNKLVQLIPNNCGYLGFTFNALSANKTETIPKSGYKSAAISLSEAPGFKSLYAVIADSAYANGEMSRLSASAISICDIEQQANKTTDVQGFTRMLEIIKKNSGDNMEWRIQRFY